MRYYKFTNHKILLPIEYEFITDDSIDKEEITAWFKTTYKPSFFDKVEEVGKNEIDVLWAIRLIKENGKIECA